MPTLQSLKLGTRFRLAEMPGITGVLVRANECRAVVRLDRPERDVEFTDQERQSRQFKCRGTHLTSWSPTTLVEPVGFETLNDEENEMSKTRKTTKAAEPKVAATEKPKRAKSDGKLSRIDAEVKILADKKELMTTKELIEAMAAKGLWSSPNEQTPAATLRSAIFREITTKGNESRFVKTDRGKFEFRN